VDREPEPEDAFQRLVQVNLPGRPVSEQVAWLNHLDRVTEEHRDRVASRKCQELCMRRTFSLWRHGALLTQIQRNRFRRSFNSWKLIVTNEHLQLQCTRQELHELQVKDRKQTDAFNHQIAELQKEAEEKDRKKTEAFNHQIAELKKEVEEKDRKQTRTTIGCALFASGGAILLACNTFGKNIEEHSRKHMEALNQRSAELEKDAEEKDRKQTQALNQQSAELKKEAEEKDRKQTRALNQRSAELKKEAEERDKKQTQARNRQIAEIKEEVQEKDGKQTQARNRQIAELKEEVEVKDGKETQARNHQNAELMQMIEQLRSIFNFLSGKELEVHGGFGQRKWTCLPYLRSKL